MRELTLDLSEDKEEYTSLFSAGLYGEHNETKLMIILPNRMVDADASYYYFSFEDKDGYGVTSPHIFKSDIVNNKIEVKLWKQITSTEKTTCNVIAEKKNGENIEIVGKSPTFYLKFKKSANGSGKIYDPYGNEEILQKVINDAIKNAKQQGFLIPEINIPYTQNIVINPNIVTNINETEGELNISLGTPIEEFSNEWVFIITQGETAYDIILPEIDWQLGIAPTFSANTTTEVRLYFVGDTLKGVWN